MKLVSVLHSWPLLDYLTTIVLSYLFEMLAIKTQHNVFLPVEDKDYVFISENAR